MGICLKSQSSKGAARERRARPAATYRNDEKKNDQHSSCRGRSMSSSRPRTASHVPSTRSSGPAPSLHGKSSFPRLTGPKSKLGESRLSGVGRPPDGAGGGRRLEARRDGAVSRPQGSPVRKCCPRPWLRAPVDSHF